MAENTASKRGSIKGTYLADFLPAIIIIVALLILGQILSPGFAKLNNLFNIVTRASILGVACIGQAFIMISGNAGIDMSVGAMMNMACLLTPMMTGGKNVGVITALLFCVAMGVIFGGINGFFIQYLKIPALVMTLAMSAVVNGLTLGLTHGQPTLTMAPFMSTLGMPFERLGVPFLGPLRPMTLFFGAVLVIMLIILHKSKYGQSLFMVGSNRNAAKLTGLHVNAVVIVAYMIGATMSAVAGFMLVSYVGSAQLAMADSYTLLSVAGVVIGGTKLAGGRGNLFGGFLGAMVLFILTSVLTTLGLPDGFRVMVQGGLLLGVLLVNSREAKLRA